MTIEVKGIEKTLAALERASFRSSGVRANVVKKVSQRILKNSKNRITRQTDLQNVPFKKRADGKRKKMLTKLRTRLKLTRLNEHGSILGFFAPGTGAIAFKHQYGSVELFNVSHYKKSSSKKRDQPATRRQAKALLKAGYKVRIKGRGYKRPSQRWIMENMTIARAGLILRLIRGTKQQWTITIPARSFLGVTEAELAEITQQVIDDEQKRINKG